MANGLNLGEAIEKMVLEGYTGPWTLGLASCRLCGATFRALVPLCPNHHPLEEWLDCDSCGQDHAQLVNTNRDVHYERK